VPTREHLVGALRAGRQTYFVETCEQHVSGLIDAIPLEDGSTDATS
jgi:hypothetical protein